MSKRNVIPFEEVRKTAVKPQELRYQKVNEVDPNNHQIGSALYIYLITPLVISFFFPSSFSSFVQTKQKNKIYPTHLIFLS
jgi:hypothetical protein